MRRTTTLALLVLLMSTLAACGEDNKVGNDKLLTFEEQAKKAALGATTSTTAAPATTIAAEGSDKAALGKATTTTAAPATTEAPRETTTTVAEVRAYDITVNSDNSGTTQFDPSSAAVYVGTVIRFTNTDHVARSIEADDGAFNSGPIPPGGNWLYKAAKAGKFNYHDGTRPYAVGNFEVLPR